MSHKLLSENILITSKQGKYREEKIGVFDETGLVYMAIEPKFVKEEMNKLFSDLKYLLKNKLSLEEVFYYAAFLHLKFIYIHPFMDGNGRAARLLEKWFLSSEFGINVWKIKSERHYFENRKEYYKKINLGPDYYEIDYDKCLPFLFMLSDSVN